MQRLLGQLGSFMLQSIYDFCDDEQVAKHGWMRRNISGTYRRQLSDGKTLRHSLESLNSCMGPEGEDNRC